MPAKSRILRYFTWILYAATTLQFIRYYVVGTTFYLNMPRYLHGQERLPFQERILPVVLMWPINHSAFLMKHLAHPNGGFDAHSAATPDTLAFYLLALVSFSIASYLVVQLYRAVTKSGALATLVFPVFMVLTLWTYVIHIDADFSYPYDMPSLAFFAGGLLAIYKRRFLPLLGIIFFGTMNRETTLFLVGIYVIDAASREIPEYLLRNRRHTIRLRERFSPGQVPWARAALLLAVWFSVKLSVSYYFRGNDNSENYVRIGENLHRLGPRLWPTLLNVCGYSLPIVVILRRKILPIRFANYLYILPLWFGVMFYTGVILESRVYGELCSFSAIAVVLLLEEHVAERGRAGRPAYLSTLPVEEMAVELQDGVPG